MGNRLRTLLTLLFYAPAISGGAYAIFQIIFSADSYGFINGALINMGLINKPINWIGDSAYMMPTAIILLLWMSFGSGFLSLIAGFKNIDKRLYEAAAIDGIQNRYQEMWYITLPSMKPQLMFAVGYEHHRILRGGRRAVGRVRISQRELRGVYAGAYADRLRQYTL